MAEKRLAVRVDIDLTVHLILEMVQACRVINERVLEFKFHLVLSSELVRSKVNPMLLKSDFVRCECHTIQPDV